MEPWLKDLFEVAWGLARNGSDTEASCCLDILVLVIDEQYPFRWVLMTTK